MTARRIHYHNGIIATHRDCNNAILVCTAPENPVLAQCKRQPTHQHPKSPYVVNVASMPACPMFSKCKLANRPVTLVNWRD